MQKDSTWKDSSASLLSFYNASMAGNFSKLSSVESSLNEGNASGAQSVLSSISSSGNIETNFINFYQAYIDYLNGNYTSADSLAVITLAQACPATDGAVVFQARSFYNSLYAIHKHFDNGCNYATMPPSARLATHLIESNRIEKEFYLYPNPTSDFLILENKNIKDFNTQVVFLDLTGRVLVEEVVSFLSGNARLSVNLPDGIYLLRLKSSFGNFLYYKIIISK